MLTELVDGTVGVECFSAFGLRRADSMTFSLALDELVSSVFATDSQVAFPPFSLSYSTPPTSIPLSMFARQVLRPARTLHQVCKRHSSTIALSNSRIQ
jgi:hypothetical protein